MGLPKRFDTVFFVCRAPEGQTPQVDAGETTSLQWVWPPHALKAHAAGEFQMEFATVSTVRSLMPFAQGNVAALLDYAASQRELAPLHPRLRVDEARRVLGVLLPGEPGYEALFGDGH
jgi:hypothetical protein